MKEATAERHASEHYIFIITIIRVTVHGVCRFKQLESCESSPRQLTLEMISTCGDHDFSGISGDMEYVTDLVRTYLTYFLVPLEDDGPFCVIFVPPFGSGTLMTAHGFCLRSTPPWYDGPSHN